MAFEVINLEEWPRKEHYAYYSEKIKTSYQMTVDLDVTKLRKRCKKLEIRFYPVMIYIIMKAINNNENFRMGVNEKGELGIYDVCHPSYTVFHKDDETFSDIWTEWNDDFDQFYEFAVSDMEIYKDVKGIKSKPDRPDAFVPISCLPWISFNNFAYDTAGPSKMYFPVIIFGKYHKDVDKYIMPFTIMINHAVADGYHTSKLINEIQELCSTCKKWLV